MHTHTHAIPQLAHHPPVTAYELEGAGGAWRFSGWTVPAVVPVVKFYGIKTMAKGNRRLVAADGSVIDVYTPAFAIKGEGARVWVGGDGGARRGRAAQGCGGLQG